MKDPTEITGQVSTITFRNSEGWAVFKVDDGTKTTNCTGTLAEMINVGTDVTCLGIFVDNNRYGPQLKCEKIYPAPVDVDSEAGIIKILQRLPGIGEKKAQLAVDKHGSKNAWQLAKTDPCKLGVKADDMATALRIATQLLPSINTTIYLLSIGLTDNKANKIMQHFGVDEALEIIKENPYRIMEIDGFGFLTADKIALQAGMGVGAHSRIMACVMHVLTDSQNNQGNIFFYGRPLVALVCDMMLESAKVARVPLQGMADYDAVRQCVYTLQTEGKVLIDDGKVFSKKLLDAEKTIESTIFGEGL